MLAAIASEYHERRYREAREALLGVGRRAYLEVVNIVLYKHWPRFLDTEHQRPLGAWAADQRDFNELRQGLVALALKFHE